MLTQSETRWNRSPRKTMRDLPIVNALASALIAGEQMREHVVARCSRVLGRPWRWLGPLAKRFLVAHAGQTRLRRREVVRFLLQDEGLREALARHGTKIAVQLWVPEAAAMQPVEAAIAWNLPAIESAGALAGWLRITPGELEWFADLKGLGARRGTHDELQHYRYSAVEKRGGGIRLLESPKPRLKAIQRQILALILNRIEPHAAAHGFRRGHSIKSFAGAHTGQRVVLRMDLRDFFPSTSGARVQAFFRTSGYPESVADLLGGLCTNATPRAVARDLYSQRHLPQGAPTSPALANLCSYRLDCRLNGLAKSVGAAYTRYADDLAFSGGMEFDQCVERFSSHVAAIAMDEGFAVNFRKTRMMRQGVRQHLAGLVTNERTNVRRVEFDRLKAILHNCVRMGPESQNREGHPEFRAHLEGRVSFVEMINPEKAQRLRATLQQIEWP
ncbi:MAG: reverse transcriptase family protein [Acidobacteriota bacterium]